MSLGFAAIFCWNAGPVMPASPGWVRTAVHLAGFGLVIAGIILLTRGAAKLDRIAGS